MYFGDITKLIILLESKGYKHAYIDDGAAITAVINLQLINEMIITKAPIWLGKGVPLFGKINKLIKLANAETIAFPHDFIQVKYGVDYL